MKMRYIYPLMLVSVLFLGACAQEGPQDSPVVAQINGFKLTKAEYLAQLATEVEFDRDFKLTAAAKKEFLEQIIRRELMIQEAQRLKLDRQPKFVQAIERYWESTLIRDLLEVKGAEIGKTAVISEAEAQLRYQQMQNREGGLPPFDKIADRLIAELREAKKTRMMDQWVDDLRAKATVRIDEKLLLKD